MRNGQNNKRMRNRNNNNNNNNNNRRGQNPMTRVFESNGPDIKIRGTASHVAEKYVQLARDARSSGDPVAAENYYQHAEHYFRLIAAAQEQFRQNQPQPRPDAEMVSEDGDEDESFSNFGQEPGFVPVQQQPYQPRDNGQRDHQQSYQPREQHQPRENHREQRSQPPFQQQPQPPVPDAGGVDRLPSFITGPQPQINGGGFEGNGGERERFPRRRRRPPHGPRPEGVAGAPTTPSDDFNPGNE
jgi:Domain of unknown function (DUF4167)